MGLFRAALCLLLLIAATACQSRPAQDKPPRNVGPQLFDCTQEQDEEPKECRHVWEQVGVHPYQRMLNGIPSVDLCAILRCGRCGQVKHECSRRRRR